MKTPEYPKSWRRSKSLKNADGTVRDIVSEPVQANDMFGAMILLGVGDLRHVQILRNGVWEWCI